MVMVTDGCTHRGLSECSKSMGTLFERILHHQFSVGSISRNRISIHKRNKLRFVTFVYNVYKPIQTLFFLSFIYYFFFVFISCRLLSLSTDFYIRMIAKPALGSVWFLRMPTTKRFQSKQFNHFQAKHTGRLIKLNTILCYHRLAFVFNSVWILLLYYAYFCCGRNSAKREII